MLHSIQSGAGHGTVHEGGGQLAADGVEKTCTAQYTFRIRCRLVGWVVIWVLRLRNIAIIQYMALHG